MWGPTLAYEGVEPYATFLLATAHVCSGAAKADDVLARFRAAPAAVADELSRLLVNLDDNADFYDKAVIPIRRGNGRLAADALRVARGTFDGPYVSAAVARVESLDRELALLMKSDKAWQSTRVASENPPRAHGPALRRGRERRRARARAVEANGRRAPRPRALDSRREAAARRRLPLSRHEHDAPVHRAALDQIVRARRVGERQHGRRRRGQRQREQRARRGAQRVAVGDLPTNSR